MHPGVTSTNIFCRRLGLIRSANSAEEIWDLARRRGAAGRQRRSCTGAVARAVRGGPGLATIGRLTGAGGRNSLRVREGLPIFFFQGVGFAGVGGANAAEGLHDRPFGREWLRSPGHRAGRDMPFPGRAATVGLWFHLVLDLERSSFDVATPGDFPPAGEARPYPGPSTAVVSAALQPPRGSVPPGGLAVGRRAIGPAGQFARRLDGDGERPRRIARLPVPRRADRRRVPRGPRLQPQQCLHVEPHAGGPL